LTLNYQKIQPSDCNTQLSVTRIVVKPTPVGVRIISSLTKKLSINHYQCQGVVVQPWHLATVESEGCDFKTQHLQATFESGLQLHQQKFPARVKCTIRIE